LPAVVAEWVMADILRAVPAAVVPECGLVMVISLQGQHIRQKTEQ
jgi:hypothetical protein